MNRYAVLIGIHPRHAKNIYNGKKKIELRKFEHSAETTRLCLAENGTGKITGAIATKSRMIVRRRLSDRDMEKLANDACITKDELCEYFANERWIIGYEIQQAIKFNDPVSLGAIGLPGAPQRFRYLEEVRYWAICKLGGGNAVCLQNEIEKGADHE